MSKRDIESRTNGDGIVDVLYFNDVSEQNAALFGALPVIIVIVVEDDTRRVDDAHPSLELDGLEARRMSCSCSDGADFASLETVDQATFADVGVSNDTDSDAAC